MADIPQTGNVVLDETACIFVNVWSAKSDIKNIEISNTVSIAKKLFYKLPGQLRAQTREEVV